MDRKERMIHRVLVWTGNILVGLTLIVFVGIPFLCAVGVLNWESDREYRIYEFEIPGFNGSLLVKE